MAAGGMAIDLPHFIKLLVMIAMFALSKATSFSMLYNTPEAKVDVMLSKWGLGDRMKLQLVKSRMRLMKGSN